MTVGKVISTACGVPIGGTIDLIKGAVKDISNSGIRDVTLASNLALITTSNSQFWFPLLLKSQDLLLVTENFKSETERLGDILFECSKKLEISFHLYKLAVKFSTNKNTMKVITNLTDFYENKCTLNNLSTFIKFEKLKDAANVIEISKQIIDNFISNKISQLNFISPTILSHLVGGIKSLHFMAEESRVKEGIISSIKFIETINFHFSRCYLELSELPQNKMAGRKSLTARTCVHHAVEDTIHVFEELEKLILNIIDSKKGNNILMKILKDFNLQKEKMKILKFLAIESEMKLENTEIENDYNVYKISCS